jgi:MoxR-like ATPase
MMRDAGPALLAALGDDVVGRRREIEIVVAALVAGRHVLLEGPPGTGKSTLLRAVARHGGVGCEFVEGNAELTPARLIGSHDPSRVLVEGYSADAFVPGPLVTALESGSLLYLEEINRIPEETLNVLVTVMSEHELHVPRLGRVVAAPGFRLVAAMNPFDAVGTARISAAVYDRTCRVAMGYQSAEDEREIVARAVAHDAEAGDDGFRARVVDLVRATRDHPDVRVGASVRGAVDLQLLGARLGALRGRPAADRAVALDAALAALSGRIRLYEGANRTPESVIEELFARIFRPDPADGVAPDPSDPGDGRGKATAPAAVPRGAGA